MSWHKLNCKSCRQDKINIIIGRQELQLSLVSLATDSNKPLLQWQGPFDVSEKVRDDYSIQLADRTKTYHANMLKIYWSREHEEMCATVIESEEKKRRK